MVAKYVALAGASGLQRWEDVAALGEAELERRLFGASAQERRVVPPEFARVHLELRRKGVTLTLLWEEYRLANDGRRTWGFTQFCEHYKAYTRTLRRSMRQQHRAGEKLFVDYAGPTLELAEGGRGRVFVAAPRASGYASWHPALRRAWRLPNHRLPSVAQGIQVQRACCQAMSASPSLRP